MNEENLTWKEVALRLGEELATVGPNGYYEFTPEQWLSFALMKISNSNDSKWISTEEQLPDLGKNGYSERVLVYNNQEVFIAYICWYDCIFDDDGNLDIECGFIEAMSEGWGYWDSESYHSADFNPSHWMPLPSVPDTECDN